MLGCFKAKQPPTSYRSGQRLAPLNGTLPLEFLLQVCRPDAVALSSPIVSKLRATAHGDESYWRAWAQEHRTPSFESYLQAARHMASRRCDAELETIAARLVEDRGLKEKTCLKSG